MGTKVCHFGTKPPCFPSFTKVLIRTTSLDTFVLSIVRKKTALEAWSIKPIFYLVTTVRLHSTYFYLL